MEPGISTTKVIPTKRIFDSAGDGNEEEVHLSKWKIKNEHGEEEIKTMP